MSLISITKKYFFLRNVLFQMSKSNLWSEQFQIDPGSLGHQDRTGSKCQFTMLIMTNNTIFTLTASRSSCFARRNSSGEIIPFWRFGRIFSIISHSDNKHDLKSCVADILNFPILDYSNSFKEFWYLFGSFGLSYLN